MLATVAATSWAWSPPDTGLGAPTSSRTCSVQPAPSQYRARCWPEGSVYQPAGGVPSVAIPEGVGTASCDLDTLFTAREPVPWRFVDLAASGHAAGATPTNAAAFTPRCASSVRNGTGFTTSPSARTPTGGAAVPSPSPASSS